MSTIERAISIAALAHAGVKNKAGAPYILHPLRVMLSVEGGEEARIVAVLHDVLEDTEVSRDSLHAAGFGDEILNALDSVTKLPSEDVDGWDAYERFIRRAAKNPIGRVVKAADLRDNMDLRRIAAPSERDFKRVAKYQKALALLAQEVD